MICKYCGGYSAENSKFCSACGRPFEIAPENAGEEYSPYNRDRQNGRQPEDEEYSPYGGDYRNGGQPRYDNRSEYGNPMNYDYGGTRSPGESRLYSDATTANVMAIVALIVGLFVSKLAGIVIGALALSKINKCIAFRDEPAFHSTRTMAKAAVIISSVLLALIIVSIILYGIFIVAVISETVDMDNFYNYSNEFFSMFARITAGV